MDVLKYTLLRCKIVDILPVLKKWNFLPESCYTKINFKRTKKDIADKISELCKENRLTMKKACELHLIYMQLNSTSKKWTVYQLSGGEGEDETSVSIPSRLQRVKKFLQTQMVLYLGDVVLNVNYYAGALWARVQVLDDNSPGYEPNSTIFFVMYPSTPYLMIPYVRPGLMDNFLRAVMIALGAHGIHALQLTGCHVSSLVELALNKQSHGLFAKYREYEETENPLARKSKKRKVPEDTFKDPRIINVGEMQKKRKLDEMNDILGKKDQPILEKLRYQVNVNFRGSSKIPVSTAKTFRSTVTFEGTSVLEGIRNLVQAGLTKWPLPNHVCQVSSLAKNYIVLSEKPASEKRKSDSGNLCEKDTVTPVR